MANPLRILHCPFNTVGHPGHLARTERELGLESELIAFRPHRFAFQPGKYLVQTERLSLWSQLAVEVKKYQLLHWARRKYDIIHYNKGQSIFSPVLRNHTTQRSLATRLFYQFYRPYQWLTFMKDLEWLHKSGKGICVTFQGDDARQGDYSLAHFDISLAQEVDHYYYFPGTDALKRKVIAKFDRYAHRIYYLNPDLGHVLPRRAEFLPYAHIDLRDWQPSPAKNERPILLHAPSHRGVKGTRYILEAVEQLRQNGVDFEFILIENMAWEEARKHYARADLLVDQLLAGWYGGLAVELMALGKPTISYIREGDLQFIPDEMRADLPIINASPSSIYAVLKTLLTTRRDELPSLGQRSRAFVEKWHDPLKIAARLITDYETIMASRANR